MNDMAPPDGNDVGMTGTTLRIARPDPVHWLWYVFGGRLRPRYREWVLRDNTARTRWLRQAVRGTVQIAPLALLMLVVLPDIWIAGASVALGLLLGLWYNIAYTNQTAERRLMKHGYEPGTLEQALCERDRGKNGDRIGRYMATYRHAEPGVE
jgi:Family of unknown function (DUF5313)